MWLAKLTSAGQDAERRRKSLQLSASRAHDQAQDFVSGQYPSTSTGGADIIDSDSDDHIDPDEQRK